MKPVNSLESSHNQNWACSKHNTIQNKVKVEEWKSIDGKP
jgi:hypothetical protein